MLFTAELRSATTAGNKKLSHTPGIVIVRRPTRLEGLRQRWGTLGQARFVMSNRQSFSEPAKFESGLSKTAQGRVGNRRSTQTELGAKSAATIEHEVSFSEYEQEDTIYQRVLERLESELSFGVPISVVDRSLVPTMDFWKMAVVVVVGQDGLVANTAKYVGDVPIIGVNPDPIRFDGILLPFKVEQARRAVQRVLDQQAQIRRVTLAEVLLNDSQKLLAFNDFFVGRANHASARYTIQTSGKSEAQSSSGILISTGAGSTGWMSSVFNMAAGVAQMLGTELASNISLSWEDRKLLWAVREPFKSQRTQATLVAGVIDEGEGLIIESLMPDGGIIFSDGVDSDFLPFNSGTIAKITASSQCAHLVIP
ncbi:MAG: NAD(+)/NADH kinase [Pirellulaceae bacterium]|nr:NAD(+)/NADH kinase [Pirellulaceae bacterium]